MRETTIAPSILSADFARLGEECRDVLDAGADWLHVDVMDGHFVPNITIGLPVVKALRNALPDAFLDVHLMISNPDIFVAQFAEAGADMVGFHPEATYHPHKVVQSIKEAGARACLVLNPATPIDWLDTLRDDLDMVLVMSVNPGFGGQSFIPSALEKITQIRERFPDLDIEVDGGVKVNNIGAVAAAGANIFVAGSAIFGSQNYGETIDAMRNEIA